MGDNLPIIRIAACNARLRSDATWAELEDALMTLAQRRWRPRWHAVRRHLNRAADALATQGVYDALRRIESQDMRDMVSIWCDEEAFLRRGWIIPEAIVGRPGATVVHAARPLATQPDN